MVAMMRLMVIVVEALVVVGVAHWKERGTTIRMNGMKQEVINSISWNRGGWRGYKNLTVEKECL